MTEINFNNLCGDVVGPNLENTYKYRQLIGTLMLRVAQLGLNFGEDSAFLGAECVGLNLIQKLPA